MNSDVKVSIICNAYNHEKYIKSALDSFIMQKTNFKYEVLIHEDASIDATADIIREYEKKYPDIIKPIYQTENQYSKKVSIFRTFQLPRVKGKYVALCEGDDYWIDEYKLQKQYDAMEEHPEIDICAHKAKVTNCNNKVISYVAPTEKECILTIEQVISGGGAYVATASLFIRADIVTKDMQPILQKYMHDYAIQIQGALRGGMLYLNDCMSVYRYMTEYSWSKKNMSNNINRIKSWETNIRVLELVNTETNYQYSDVIEKCILQSNFFILKIKKDYKAIKKGECKKIYKEMNLKNKCAYQMERYLPKLYKSYIEYKRKGH